jgi:hypothetical protein
MDRIITPASTVCIPGGTSIYFSSAIAALPVRYALVTALADADASALASLRHKGVDITAYSVPHTLFFENRYGEDPNERTQRVLEVAEPFTPEQVTEIDASIYHLGHPAGRRYPGFGNNGTGGKRKAVAGCAGLLT